jgi:hypothetical protein
MDFIICSRKRHPRVNSDTMADLSHERGLVFVLPPLYGLNLGVSTRLRLRVKASL